MQWRPGVAGTAILRQKDAIGPRVRPPLVALNKTLATACDSGNRGKRRSAPTAFGTDSKVSLPLCESFRESSTTVLRFVATKWNRRSRRLGATLYSDFRLSGEGREAGAPEGADRLEADEKAGLKYFRVFGDRGVGAGRALRARFRRYPVEVVRQMPFSRTSRTSR